MRRHADGKVGAADIVAEFGMTDADAKTFLSWVQVGVGFKEENIDGSDSKMQELGLAQAAKLNAD